MVDSVLVFAPLTFSQLQVWVMEQIAPGNSAYGLPVAYRLSGSLSIAALEASVKEIVARHAALRTTFAFEDGEPKQLIHPHCSVDIKVTSLDHLAPDEPEQTLQLLLKKEVLTTFDLARLPLFRFSLFRQTETEHGSLNQPFVRTLAKQLEEEIQNGLGELS